MQVGGFMNAIITPISSQLTFLKPTSQMAPITHRTLLRHQVRQYNNSILPQFSHRKNLASYNTFRRTYWYAGFCRI